MNKLNNGSKLLLCSIEPTIVYYNNGSQILGRRAFDTVTITPPTSYVPRLYYIKYNNMCNNIKNNNTWEYRLLYNTDNVIDHTCRENITLQLHGHAIKTL